MTEMVMRKMEATRVGQIGLFVASPVSEDDFSATPHDKDLLVTAKPPRNPRQFALAWALATKIAESCDWIHDKQDGMDWLKIKARHVRMLQDPRTGQVAIVPKSIAFASLSQQNFSRVFNRMVYVTTTEIIPGLKESDLRREIEAMTGAA